MSKSVKSVTIRDGSVAALKAKHPQRQSSSSSSASNVSSSPDLPHSSGASLPANDSTSSLNKSQKPSRSNSACSANGRVPSIPIPVNRPEMDMMCPLSPTGISLKATRPPVIGDDPVSNTCNLRACVRAHTHTYMYLPHLMLL